MSVGRTYRVFISSSFEDTRDARKAAISGVSHCGHVPVALDTFGPDDAADREVIERETDGCHIYILILGYRYGKYSNGQSYSFTESEYRRARDAKKHIMVWALPWADVEVARKGITDQVELAHTQDLWDFYELVKSNHFVTTWDLDNVGQIGLQVVHKLMELRATADPPRGLVDEFGSPEEQLAAGAVKNVFLKPIVRSIVGFETLYGRTDRHIDEKTKAAKFFVERYQPCLEAKAIRGIFFESGSTPAFLAREFPDSFWKKIEFGDRGEPNRLISTNNVLVYLHLWLERHVPCGHFPWGEPEGTYGATYGPIANLVDTSANFDGVPLDKWAREAIQQLLDSPRGLKKHNTSLIVMAASGLQLGGNHDIVKSPDYDLPPRDVTMICERSGPHVGSYKNMVFKRYLLETHIPTVLMIDGSKIDSPIDVARCHFVLGRDLTWEAVCERQPLAILIGCASDELSGLEARVQAALPRFSVTTSATTERMSAFIVSNELFDKEFPERSSAPVAQPWMLPPRSPQQPPP
jgi:hypothetical protein